MGMRKSRLSIRADCPNNFDFTAAHVFDDDDFTGRRIDTGQCSNIYLMRDEHVRSIELVLTNPRCKRAGLWFLLIKITKKRVQNWQHLHSAEIQQRRRFQTAAPLARKHMGIFDPIRAEAVADMPRLRLSGIGKVSLRRTISKNNVLRISNTKRDRVAHQRDMSFGPQRFP